MLKLTVIVLIFVFTGCASVKKRSSPLGDDRYLVNCDGNGYASTGDTMQCLAEAANEICAPQGRKFRFLDSNTDSQLHVGVNLANGNPVPHMRPHSAATIECYDSATGSKNATAAPTSESGSSISIASDLSVTSYWFFSGKGKSTKDASVSSAASTTSRTVTMGENFGVGLKFSSSREKVRVRIELHVPHSPERFPSHSGQVSIGEDKKTVFVDYVVPGSKGKFAHYWGFGQGDPIGRYELKVYVEDVPIETYTFSTQEE
jgi:hypothetical protein